MRRMVYKYRISKFKRFTQGLLFAIIAIIALTMCLADIWASAEQEEIILPFCIAIISILMGFISMFRKTEIPKQKI